MEEGDIFPCIVFFFFVLVCDILSAILIKYHSSILFVNRNILTYLNLTIIIAMSLAVNCQVFFVFFKMCPKLFSRRANQEIKLPIEIIQFNNRLKNKTMTNKTIFQNIGSIFRMIVGIFPLPLAVAVRVVYFSCMLMVVLTTLADLAFRSLLIFKVFL